MLLIAAADPADGGQDIVFNGAPQKRVASVCLISWQLNHRFKKQTNQIGHLAMNIPLTDYKYFKINRSNEGKYQ